MTSGASINREVIEEIVHWLLDGARTASRPDHIVQALCERFVESGIPLVRAAVFVRTFHPK